MASTAAARYFFASPAGKHEGGSLVPVTEEFGQRQAGGGARLPKRSGETPKKTLRVRYVFTVISYVQGTERVV